MSDPRPGRLARWRRARLDRSNSDEGFALIEYIISIAIMALITTSLAGAVIVVFRNQTSATERNDASNGSLGLTNYFPVDISATPPGGRETTASLDTGCSGYSDSGFNVIRLTWSEALSATTTNYRVAYRLVDRPDGGELLRVSCNDAGGIYGSAKVTKVAFGLVRVPDSWTAGSAPAVLAPLTGDGAVTLTLTTLVGTSYTVEGTRLNPASHLDPSDPPAPAVAMETSMTLTVANYSSAGQVLTYNVSIANTGAVPLVGVAPTFANATVGTACATVLASGVTTTCTATHTVTQEDLDSGSITATIASVGYYSVFTAAAADVNTITAAAAPSLSAVLTSSSSGYSTDNELISYSMLVTNTGNISINDVTPTYSNSTATAACAPLPLAPGASATCTSTHNVTAAEYAGAVPNVGTVTGTTTNFGTTAPTSTPALDVAFIALPKLTITDFTSNPTTYVAKDDVLTFSVVVANTGNVDLTNLQVTYNHSLNNQSCPTSIPRGTSVTCTATEQVEQEDVDRGSITTRATAGATYQSTAVSATATVISAAQGRPVISLLLVPGSTQYTSTGQVLNYTLEVTNVGTVTLTGITPSYSNATSTAACAPLPLAPGATATCTASHTVTSAELGSNISVSASAVGTTASNGNTSNTSASAVVVNFLPQPTVSIVSLVASPSPFTAIGQAVTFTATIRNTGNVALSNVSLAWANATAVTSCPTSLAIGATATCTGTHTATTTDSIAGFSATATASATYATTGVSSQASITVPSAVPCTVVSPTSGGIAAPTTVALISTNGPNKGFLSADVVITVNTSALCSGLRIKYFPQSPNSVIADLTLVSSGVWTYTIPGQNASAPATWRAGVKSVQILPAASVGSTAIYTNSSAFTVT